MKFIYACDVHGDEKKYDKILDIAKKQGLKYIVLGGDLWPKYDRNNRKMLQTDFIANYFDEYFEKLDNENVSCILIPGNDDLEMLDGMFETMLAKHNNVYNVDEKKLDIDGICFIGLSKVLDHPFGSKNRIVVEDGIPMQEQLSDKIYIDKGSKVISVDEWREYRKTNVEKIKDALANLPLPTEGNKLIYILHEPPYGVGLDACLDGSLVGSKDMVDFIKESGAYMTLHGHIHESPIISNKHQARIGKTICIQPGQYEYGSDKLIYMLIDTDNDEFLNCFCELDR